MEIRSYRQEDRSGLIALWEAVFPHDPPHNRPAAVIDAKLKVDELLFVATEGEKVIGSAMAGYDGHRGWLYSIAVAPHARRQGLGSQLVQHATQELEALGCIKVNLQVRSTNNSVVAFYESLGFKAEDRISMGKKLVGAAGA